MFNETKLFLLMKQRILVVFEYWGIYNFLYCYFPRFQFEKHSIDPYDYLETLIITYDALFVSQTLCLISLSVIVMRGIPVICLLIVY